MSSMPAPTKATRLISLDVLRGLTIAAMILVNNQGDWNHIYGPLAHAKWNGWTPTDLIFPGFLFMVGVAMTFSFESRLSRGDSKVRLFEQVVRRTIILFLLGVIIFAFNDWRLMAPYLFALVGVSLVFWDDPPLGLGHNTGERLRKAIGWVCLIAGVAWFIKDFAYFNTPHPPVTAAESPLRVPGVLQRIGLCYFFASLIVMYFGTTGRVVWTALLLGGYWWIVRYVDAPADYVSNLSPERAIGRLHDWIDVKLLGAHLYKERPEPEGILSTMPAIATTMIGVLVGDWLHSYREKRDHALGLFFFGNVLIVAGLWWHHEFPINKKIWSSSYVLLAGGIAMELLAMCYWLIDVKGKKVWAWPFFVFGTNAIAVYVAASIFARILRYTKVGDGGKSLGTWLYEGLCGGIHRVWPAAAAEFTSAAWGFLYILLFFFLLIPLYRRRIFIKV